MRRFNVIVSIMNFLGGISGLISLGVLVFYGGAMWQTVRDHGRRIDNIENGGSVSLRTHVSEDDERIKELRSRALNQEAFQAQYGPKLMEIVADVRVINVKLDAIKEQINNRP